MYILLLEGKNRYSLFVAGIVVVGRIFKAKKNQRLIPAIIKIKNVIFRHN